MREVFGKVETDLALDEPLRFHVEETAMSEHLPMLSSDSGGGKGHIVGARR